jgi:hypothetical protein
VRTESDMRTPRLPLVLCALLSLPLPAATSDAWIPLFDGRSLQGWRASEHQDTFRVEDGVLVVHGKRSHLFYVGPVKDHTFTDFEFEAEVLTKPGANSGVYFHTAYQRRSWPSQGYEIQINQTHSDWRRTGSLYGVEDVRESPAKDNEWFTLRIRVQGKRITAWVNDRQTIDYVEPEKPDRRGRFARRVLGSGTFALQGHDPDSEVHFRQIKVRPLD